MIEPIWLDREDALGIHDMMLAQHGGLAGIRDEGMVEFALARARNLHAYGSKSIPSMAAGYAAGVVKNHPFLDGNKRTGFMLAATFLELNGFELIASEESVVTQTLGLAASEVSDERYATWLDSDSRPV